MLVALVVFGLVMAGIAQSLRFGVVAFRESGRQAMPAERLGALDRALTEIIGGALPGSVTGERDRIVFTTRLPAGAGIGNGLADAEIVRSAGTLLLRYGPHPPGVPLTPLPAPRTEMLASGVEEVRWSYLVGIPPGWVERWSGTGLPLLIRLHLKAAGSQWPDLVIAVLTPN